MDTKTYCVFLILLVIITLAFLKYNIFVYEKFDPPAANVCTLSSSQIDEIWILHAKMKGIMTDLKDFPWPNMNSFMILYTVYITRTEYLLNTYGNKLSSHHFLPLITMDSVTDIMNDYMTNHAGLLQEVFDAYLKIATIIGTTSNNPCPVCDSAYIQVNLHYIDHEFSLYIADLFPDNLGEINEPERKLLAQIEVDMYNLTDVIGQAITKREMNAKGMLYSEVVDTMFTTLQNNFLLASASLDLYKFLKKNIDDIGAFIDLKKLVVDDIKQCVLTPILYDKCNFTGNKVSLIEGQYVISDLYRHYKITNIASMQVPFNYNVILHMGNGDVRVENNDVVCMRDSNYIQSITISLKKKTR